MFRTSSHSIRCRLVSISLFFPLVWLGPRFVVLVVVLSLSQSFFLCFAQHLIDSISIFAALVCSTPQVDLLIVDLSRLFQPFVLCVETSSRCACCSVVSGGYLLKYSYFRRTGSCKLMFHSPKLLSIRPFSHRFEFDFCLAVFCTFVIAFLKRLPCTQPSHAIAKRTIVDAYKYIYIYINSMRDWIRLHFPW